MDTNVIEAKSGVNNVVYDVTLLMLNISKTFTLCYFYICETYFICPEAKHYAVRSPFQKLCNTSKRDTTHTVSFSQPTGHY